MKRDPKAKADQEAINQALDQLQQSMEMVQQIVRRLHRSVNQAQANLALQQSKNALRDTGADLQRPEFSAENCEGDELEMNYNDDPRVLH